MSHLNRQSTTNSFPFSWKLLLMLAVFCVVLGQKLILIDRYGSDLPFWDQWDAEGDRLYIPYIENRLGFGDLVRPHNEHRIFFTRILSLGLLEANQRIWDCRLQIVVNALLHSSVALLFLYIVLHALPFGPALGFSAIAAVFFSTPLAWENTIAGFQSQFYFLLLFALLHLAGTFLSKPRTLAWWLAPLAGVASLFSMGSGFLSAAAILSIYTLNLILEKRFTREDLWVMSTNCILVTAGWLLRVEFPGHDALKTNGIVSWINAWALEIVWPIKVPALAPLVILPPIIALTLFLRRKLANPQFLLILALCSWAGLQTAALAYTRGGTSYGYSPRYSDLFSISVLIILFTSLYIATRTESKPLRICIWIVVSAYCGLLLPGHEREKAINDHDFLHGLPTFRQARLDSVRSYVFSQDPSFHTKIPYTELPYPYADYLAQQLDKPTIREILPFSVRPPIATPPDEIATNGFKAARPEDTLPKLPQPLTTWISGIPDGQPQTFVSEPFTTHQSRNGLFVTGTKPPGSFTISLIDQSGTSHPLLEKNLRLTSIWKRVNFSVPAGTYRLKVTGTGSGTISFTQLISETHISRLTRKVSTFGPAFHWVGMCLFSAIFAFLLILRQHHNTDTQNG